MSHASHFDRYFAEDRKDGSKLPANDRRVWPRINISLPIRMVNGVGIESDADTVDISAGGMRFLLRKAKPLESEIVIHSKDLGHLPARVVRQQAETVSVEFVISELKRERIIDKLTWLLNADTLGLQDERKSERIQAVGNVLVKFENGDTVTCKLLDVSLHGMALESIEKRPELGTIVLAGHQKGKVMRYFDRGFAIEFLR